jgi:hypothetical protein
MKNPGRISLCSSGNKAETKKKKKQVFHSIHKDNKGYSNKLS